MKERNVTDFRISYIKSAANPADKPSRGENYDDTDLRNALSSIQQLPSEWGLGMQTFQGATPSRGQGRHTVPPTRQLPSTVAHGN